MSLHKSRHPCTHRFEALTGSAPPPPPGPLARLCPALGRGGSLIHLAPLPPAWASFPPFRAGSWAQGISVALSFASVPPVNSVMTRCPLQWKCRVLTTESPGKSF